MHAGKQHTDLLLCGVLLPIGYVVSNGASKQHRLLTDQPDVPAEPPGVQVTQVVPTCTPHRGKSSR